MDTGRRDFLATLGVATIGSAGLTLLDTTPAPAQQAAGYWDLSWTGRLTGKHRAIFDIPAIEDGYGVWRSILWRKQYSQVFGLPESDLNTVVNIRHDGIALVMNQEFWARYNVGRTWDVRDPLSRQPTSRNPVVDRTGPHALPGEYEDFSLEALMAQGGIVLACALALRDCTSLVAEQEKLAMDDADRRVRQMILPGVIIQPSGVFAAVLAQENGCHFVRAS
ncbi:MAG: hypothetical protein AABY91_01980 [Gemmatimonadota bacterium]